MRLDAGPPSGGNSKLAILLHVLPLRCLERAPMRQDALATYRSTSQVNGNEPRQIPRGGKVSSRGVHIRVGLA